MPGSCGIVTPGPHHRERKAKSQACIHICTHTYNNSKKIESMEKKGSSVSSYLDNIFLHLSVQGTRQPLYFHGKCCLQNVMNQTGKGTHSLNSFSYSCSLKYSSVFITQVQFYWKETCVLTAVLSRGFCFLCILWGSCTGQSLPFQIQADTILFFDHIN